jgi:SAM-dependent methyltransferase
MDLPTAFPVDAVNWLIGRSARTVLCLGGPEIAAAAAESGHDVAAVADPDSALPFNERSIDVVVAAGRLPADLAAVATLLRPGGHLALVTKARDHRIPWARKLDREIGKPAADPDATATLIGSPHFGFVEEQQFRFWESVNRGSLAEKLRAELGTAADADRRLAAGLALYDDYGRGHDGMQLPWVAECAKATVLESFWGSPMSQDETGEFPAVPSEAPEAAPAEPLDDAMLLIDFR